MGTWWIDEPNLLGSSNPTAAELEELRQAQFTAVVCLLHPDEQAPRYDVRPLTSAGWEWHNIPIRDFTAPSLEQLQDFVALVNMLLSTRKVIVHCEGGSGRTGTVAAAYWIAKGLSVEEAIGRVRAHRPHAVET